MQKNISLSTNRAYSFKWLLLGMTLLLMLLPDYSFAQEVITALPSITLDQPAISNIYGADWSPDGQFLAVATNSGAWIFTPTLQKIVQLTIPMSIIYEVDWNTDGTKLAGGGVDGKVHIWDVKDLNHISPLNELTETNMVSDVKWNPNTRVATPLLVPNKTRESESDNRLLV
jgi:WD40 repeat protein